MRRLILLFTTILLAVPAWAVKPVDIYTKSLVAGQNGVAYSAAVKAKFGTKPYTWSIGSGALPTGLSIAGATGVISGTPTVNNTFNFVVHIVDSAGSPTTDNQSLYIIITGSAPAPTPSVSVMTTSVPNGVVGGAYNTTLQATGGTAPYTWSIPNGALPPGVSLAPSTGVASGTATLAGTYGFTARVTDSSSTAQISDRALAASIAAATGSTTIFSNGFEGGNFAAWQQIFCGTAGNPELACTNGANEAFINSNATYVHSGTYSLGLWYHIWNLTTGGTHESNRYAQIGFNSSNGYPSGLSEFYTRGYVYIKQPEPDATQTQIQRKMIYIKAPSWSGGDSQWGVILSTNWPAPLTWSIAHDGPGCSGVPNERWTNLPTYSYNTWYSLEVHVKANTPGVSDGVIQVWVGGILAYTNSAVNLRGNCTTNITRIAYGDQVNQLNMQLTDVIDEYRYWDDIVISATGPIGP